MSLNEPPQSPLLEETQSPLLELGPAVAPGNPIIQVQLMGVIKQWPGVNFYQWSAQSMGPFTLANLYTAMGGWSGPAISNLPQALRYACRYTYENVDWTCVFHWLADTDDIPNQPAGTNTQTGTLAFSGGVNADWPVLSTIDPIDLDNLPNSIVQSPITPAFGLALGQPWGIPLPYNSGPGYVDYSLTTIGSPSSASIAYTVTGIPVVTGVYNYNGATQTLSLTLSGEITEAGLVANVTSHLTALAAAGWTGSAGWTQGGGLGGTYPEVGFWAYHEWGDPMTAAVGDEVAETTPYFFTNPLPSEAGPYGLPGPPEFYAEGNSDFYSTVPVSPSPIIIAGGNDQTTTLMHLCSYWGCLSLEESYGDPPFDVINTPMFGMLCRWKADREVTYWMASAHIPRWQDFGNTGLAQGTAPLEITLLSSGTAAAGEIVDIPLPSAGTFTSLGSGTYAGLSMGEMVFCVIGETIAAWQTRTGLTVIT